MSDAQINPYRLIPSIDALLQDPAVSPLLSSASTALVSDALREATQQLRQQIAAGEGLPPSPTQELAQKAQQILAIQSQPHLRRVINATGVVLHTNLGRAPLSAGALARVEEACSAYSNLELDLDSGQRGSRHTHVESLLVGLCSKSSLRSLAAVVVNNCAAAMMLIVDEFARGREVIVSRGELVEIGGGFRVPDVLTRGGAKLVEVGCTNRTRIADFASAINENTGMLLSTHLSNFAQSGFVESPSAHEFVELARKRGLVSCYDLGSGMLRPDPRFPEISVQQAVQQGFDLVAFSGDKLLGGPQAGIIIGQPDLIARLKKNPMMRALRVDKLILAALEGTLLGYLDPPNAWNNIPVLEMLGRGLEAIRPMADFLAEGLTQLLKPFGVTPEVVSGKSSTGGGSLPGFELDTWNVRVPLSQEDRWASHLRQATPPVLVRRNAGAILLDPRTLTQSELPLVISAFECASKRMLTTS